MVDVEKAIRLRKVEKAIDTKCFFGKSLESWCDWAQEREKPKMTPEQAIEQQDRIGVTKAVVMPTSDPPYYYEDQEYVMKVCQEYPDRFPVALCRVNWIAPEASIKEIEKCAKIPQYKGVMCYPEIAEVAGNDIFGNNADKVLAKMKDVGWDIVAIDGPPYGGDLSLDLVAEKYPEIKFLVYDRIRSDLLERRKNIYPTLRYAISPPSATFADRYMFGSGAPYTHYLVSLPVLVHDFDVLKVPKEILDKVLYKNAEKVFGIRA